MAEAQSKALDMSPSVLLIEALVQYAACGIPPKWALLVPSSDNKKVYEALREWPAAINPYPYVEFPKKALNWPSTFHGINAYPMTKQRWWTQGKVW